MKLRKYILMTSALLMTFAAYADDFESFGEFGDFGGDESSDFEKTISKIEVNGEASVDVRAYVDTDNTDKVEVKATPAGRLDLSYSGNNSDLQLNLKIDEDTIKNHPLDVIDEAVLRGRFGDYVTLEAGKMKVVWGKGDKLHVLDNFNSDNYTDFIIPDYLDRRISTPMLRGIISLPFANLNIEGVYTPLLPVDNFAASGRWTPAQVTRISDKALSSAEKTVKTLVEDCETNRTGLSVATALSQSSKAQAEVARKAAVTYGEKVDAYDKGLTQLNNGINQINAGISQLDAAIQQAQNAGQTSTVAALTAQKNTLTTQLASLTAQKNALTSTEMVATIAHCKAEKTAQEEAAKKYDEAAKEADTKAEEYKNKLKTADTAYTKALTYATSLSQNIYPNLLTLKYGQFGGRATWTLGQIDMGISYYNGWYKQPSFNEDKLDAFIASYLAKGSVSEDEKFLAYDKKQTFGIEASSIIWHFNVRGEFAYNLTDDMDGTNPWVHNNSIAWLGGFDIDLPFWNSNLNVQEIGTYVLHGDECNKKQADVDYAANGYSNNKLAVNLTTSFMNDKIAPEVTVMYGFENKDLVVMPKLVFKADQNLTLLANGMYIWCGDADSEFKAWEKNSFVSLSAKYQF